ncbi:MAG: Alkyl hydroperoxide reductase subunit C-like protein, partial [uncultured Acidimicrobiales bacterium]
GRDRGGRGAGLHVAGDGGRRRDAVLVQGSTGGARVLPGRPHARVHGAAQQ